MMTSIPAQGTPSRRGRPRDPGAGTRIRDAAVSLLLEHGVAGMTIDAVAERAGVGKATVYRRWASKDELALAAIEAMLTDEVRVPDTGSLLGDLTVLYEDLLRLASEGPQGLGFFRTAAAEAARDQRIADLYRVSTERRRERCNVVLDRAVRRGELSPDADRALIFDWPTGLVLMRVLSNMPLPTAAEAATLAYATLHGFAHPPRPA
jgi:AcrR family transcriptional regulator